jgi:hypothetical protein
MRAQEIGVDQKFSSGVGTFSSAPLGPLSRYAKVALGANYDAGYNLSKHHAIVGEFMWNLLDPSDGALQPIRELTQTNNVSGHSNLFALTADYKYELSGRLLGTYLIGGGGWYIRTASISTAKPVEALAPCQPIVLWWGYTCASPTTTELTASSNSSAFGGSVGIGFTVRVGERPYRWYIESRYHYAPTKDIKTQLITLGIGFRY